MPYGEHQSWAHVAVPAKQGAVLIYDQNILHSGAEVFDGEKYVLRLNIYVGN